jgi:hypothetical protein
MAIPIIPILKAIGPLLAASSGIAERAGQNRNLATEERVKKLEDELLKMSQILASSMEQLQAAAEALRVQSEQNEAREGRLRTAMIIAVLASCLSAAALTISLL